MLAIEVHLLAGRYGATVYNARSKAEWPPHPGRLFSALVHAWADADDPDPAERAALAWLEEQPPPQIVCSGEEEIARRSVVTVYVPGNDPSSLASPAPRLRKADARHGAAQRQLAAPSPKNERAAAKALAEYRKAVVAAAAPSGSTPRAELEVLPELRNRQPRQFPVVRPDDPRIQFRWPDAAPDTEQRARLDGLLARVARLGHSATQVSCRITTEPALPPRFVPTPQGHTFVRVPRRGLLDRLEREFARHQGIRERQMPAPLTEYGPPAPEDDPVPSGLLAGDWIVLQIDEAPRRHLPGREDLMTEADAERRNPAVGLTRTLELTRAVRDALVAAHPAAEQFLTGRYTDGQARPHLAVVPLADVGHRWATNVVRGVALVLPLETDAADRAAVQAAVGAWWDSGGKADLIGARRVIFEEPILVPHPGAASSVFWSDVPYALRRTTWCRPSRRWASVTPVALDGYVRGLHRSGQAGEAADRRAAELLTRSCRFAGLPEPIAVTVAPLSSVAGIPRASGADRRRAFPSFVAATSGTARQSTHATVTFDRPVAGPVLLGAGRYLGRGLFMPVRDERDPS